METNTARKITGHRLINAGVGSISSAAIERLVAYVGGDRATDGELAAAIRALANQPGGIEVHGVGTGIVIEAAPTEEELAEREALRLKQDNEHRKLMAYLAAHPEEDAKYAASYGRKTLGRKKRRAIERRAREWAS